MNPQQERLTRRNLIIKGLTKGGLLLAAPLAAACTTGEVVPARSAPSVAPARLIGDPNPNMLRTPEDFAIFDAWKKLVKEKEFRSAGVTAELLDYQESSDGLITAIWKVPSWYYTKKVQFRGFHTELNTLQIEGQTTSYLLRYEWRQSGLLKDQTYGPYKEWRNTLDAVGCFRAAGVNPTPQCTAYRSLDGLQHIIYTGVG